MAEHPTPEPLLSGRGVLRIQDFCRSTGLTQRAVEDLIRSGRIEGVLWTPTEPASPVGIFDDVLPSREVLLAMGFDVRSDYAPEALRSFESTSNEPEDDGAI